MATGTDATKSTSRRKPRKRSKCQKCLVCGKKPARARGQCQTDYKSSSRMVERGETSWEELEKRGLAEKPGRKRNNNVYDALKRSPSRKTKRSR